MLNAKCANCHCNNHENVLIFSPRFNYRFENWVEMFTNRLARQGENCPWYLQRHEP